MRLRWISLVQPPDTDRDLRADQPRQRCEERTQIRRTGRGRGVHRSHVEGLVGVGDEIAKPSGTGKPGGQGIVDDAFVGEGTERIGYVPGVGRRRCRQAVKARSSTSCTACHKCNTTASAASLDGVRSSA